MRGESRRPFFSHLIACRKNDFPKRVFSHSYSREKRRNDSSSLFSSDSKKNSPFFGIGYSDHVIKKKIHHFYSAVHRKGPFISMSLTSGSIPSSLARGAMLLNASNKERLAAITRVLRSSILFS